MDASQSNRVHEIFDEAVEAPPDRRAEALIQLCGDNFGLRQAVESLLRAHDTAGDFFSEPHLPPQQFISTDYYPPGTRIDRYTLIGVIGDGGHGTVYLAEQDSPLRRHVAMKIIKSGMATQQVIERFDLERQSLALMDHPGIATVFDAGSTESGRPYFVMELVEGKLINEFCREFKLDLRARLMLFVAVCKAVQHAHQKGVIHRDLKPGNILVALKDGRPTPKVIDFGIVKALELDEQSTASASPHFLGTPQYISPEQASAPRGVADWRSDVYSLGAVLYELLADAPPYDPKQFASASYADIERIVREFEPPAPSQRLLEEADRRPEPQAVEFRERAANVHGNLDHIVTTAMRKNVGQRYQSVEEMTHELERYLSGAPLAARLNDGLQRRFRWLAASFFVLLLLTGGGFVVQMRRIAHLRTAPLSRSGQPAIPMEQLASGLVADLYNGGFAEFVMTRIDREIDFGWPRANPPEPGMRFPRYSIRWKGILVVPPSGASYIGFRADDGAQVYLDGELVLTFDRPRKALMDRSVSPGQHRIHIEYRNILARGGAALLWKLPDGQEEVVPAGALFHVKDDPSTRRAE